MLIYEYMPNKSLDYFLFGLENIQFYLKTSSKKKNLYTYLLLLLLLFYFYFYFILFFYN